jgi:hypothetical protein
VIAVRPVLPAAKPQRFLVLAAAMTATPAGFQLLRCFKQTLRVFGCRAGAATFSREVDDEDSDHEDEDNGRVPLKP